MARWRGEKKVQLLPIPQPIPPVHAMKQAGLQIVLIDLGIFFFGGFCRLIEKNRSIFPL